MNPWTQLQTHYNDFTKSEQKLARYLLDHPQCLMGDPLNQIAEQAGSSNAAMVRLCQKLGYSGFSDFRFSMRRALLSGPGSGREGAEGEDPYRDILDTYIGYINQIPSFVSREELQKAARAICSADRIAIWGANRTFLPAQQLSHRLRRMGIFNEASNDSVVMQDNANILGKGDCYIIFTLKGRGFRYMEEYAADLRKNGCYVLLVTMDPKIPAAQRASQVITLPCPSQDDSPNFLEDQIVVFLFIELLLHEVSKCYQG